MVHSLEKLFVIERALKPTNESVGFKACAEGKLSLLHKVVYYIMYRIMVIKVHGLSSIITLSAKLAPWLLGTIPTGNVAFTLTNEMIRALFKFHTDSSVVNLKTCAHDMGSSTLSKKSPTLPELVFSIKMKCPYGTELTRRPRSQADVVKRGLYRTSDRKTMNADIHGAANIIRKSNHRLNFERVARGLWANPLRVKLS